ncbi:serine hydrolase [Longimycelium tulufanense]|uniref:Serine hydrolase n=1 Tax=Longimycelium tulufanense TaxID=907463 RepID=A0A8J3FUM1_9PSEU|nr:serine hydrolase domain-containing protein [Longimycelium tulufanense]GGM56290.1 serine hydrolase [Longimycelium tulufanense]
MRLSIRRLTGAVLAAALFTGVSVTTAVAAPDATGVGQQATHDRSELREAMRELVAAGAVGVQVRVHNERGDWTGSEGTRLLRGGGKVPTDGRFRIGSISKTMLSTVVLQLVGEGKIGLDDPVDRYLPRFGLDVRITVRMLLQHTSGIFNYTGESKEDGTVEPGIPLFGQDFVDNRFRTYQPDELVRLALSKPARFEPGQGWSYSNTNYVLAGLLVEKVTGRSYATEMRHRILWPLGMWQTSLPGTRTTIPGPHAHGYHAFQREGELQVVDATRLNPSWAYGAGEVISTTRDLDTFISALLGGKLLPPNLLAEMRRMRPTNPVEGYGLGLAETTLGLECGETMLGHGGGIHGYVSFLYGNADLSKRFQMSVTTGAVDLDNPDAAAKFFTPVLKIMNLAVCGKTTPAKPDAAQSQDLRPNLR